MCDYPEFVKPVPLTLEEKEICIKDKIRKSLVVKFNKEITPENNLVVICFNPSKACSYRSDKTINEVLNFAYYGNVENKPNKYSGVIIFNIFPDYETLSSKAIKLATKYKVNECKAFAKYITTYLDKNLNCDVFLAWGKFKRVHIQLIQKQIIDNLKKNETHRVFCMITEENNYFPHPCRKGKGQDFEGKTLS